MLPFRSLPKYEALREQASLYPELDASAIVASLATMSAGSELHAAYEAYLLRHGLSTGRFVVLMCLYRAPEGAASPADLAEKTGVTRATMTGLLDTLEQAAYVVRHDDPHDRRMITIRLTDSARDLLGAILPDHYRRTAALMAALSERERATLMKLLTKVVAGVGSLKNP